jgi:hypothetical protein
VPDDVETSAQSVVVCEALPEVPVTEMLYVPVLVEDVVVAVRMEVCAVALLIETEAGDRPQVVGLVAPVGELVTEHVRETVPVNELAGVTVMVEVLPLVPPGVTEMLPLLERVKLLVPLGRSQNFEQPTVNTTTTSEAAANNTRAHFLAFIAVPSLHFPYFASGTSGADAHRVLCHFSRISLRS